MKKVQRVSMITHILTENPNRDFSLGHFAELFQCAKSSVSDDIKFVREAVEASGMGYLETTSGIKGGVRYVPYISREEALRVLTRLKETYEEPDRALGSGFLYNSDIMYSPQLIKGVARIFAKQFANAEADIIVTVESKGIGLAVLTGELLNIPVAVIRHESRVTEGSTLSINYFSGSTDRIQQMSLSKRAIKPGSRALILDDFMRGGGSIKGIQDMLAEFDAQTVGVGVVVVVDGLENKKIGNFVHILMMEEDENHKVNMEINPLLL